MEYFTFDDFVDKYLLEYYSSNPAAASSLGLHEYDGLLSDVSEEGFELNLRALRSLSEEILTYDRKILTEFQKYEYDLCKWSLDSSIFEYEVIQSHKNNPMFYVSPFSNIGNYLNREYEEFDFRAESILLIMKKIPAILNEGKNNLNKVCPAIFCKYGIEFAQGYISFFEKELAEVIRFRANDESIVAQYAKLCKSTVKSIRDYIKFIEKELMPFADESYRLGEVKFLKMLEVKEHVKTDLKKLRTIGENELASLLKMRKKLLKDNPKLKESSHQAAHPKADSLVQETDDCLKELVEFITEKEIIDIPENLNCIVKPLPKYMGFGFAAMDTAGAYEDSDESFYFVNVPPPDWSEEKTEEWMSMFNYNNLKMISIHEAFPGHYLHFLYANSNNSKMSKICMSYSYVEGWAHYCEELMIEMGFEEKNSHMKLSYIDEALVRCCRYLVAIGLHVDEMTIENAKEFFMENSFLSEVNALQEAERGAFDPGYINYTLGKIMLRKLKKKFFAKFKDKYTLNQFHQKIVSIGIPTFDIAEKYILQSKVI
ncbi:DUF885 domain-containing protein [soil metagenome]